MSHDAEEIRPFPRNTLYEVSSLGRIRRVGATVWLRPCVLKRGGYLAVNLWRNNTGRTWTVHRIVALTFCGEPAPGQTDVAHYDGDKRNNRASNLRWATRAENEADKVRHGRANVGERNGQAKISNDEAETIRARYLASTRRHGMQSALASEFGVSAAAISNIVNNRRRA